MPAQSQRVNVSILSLKWSTVISTLLPGGLVLFAIAAFFPIFQRAATLQAARCTSPSEVREFGPLRAWQEQVVSKYLLPLNQCSTILPTLVYTRGPLWSASGGGERPNRDPLLFQRSIRILPEIEEI